MSCGLDHEQASSLIASEFHVTLETVEGLEEELDDLVGSDESPILLFELGLLPGDVAGSPEVTLLALRQLPLQVVVLLVQLGGLVG